VLRLFRLLFETSAPGSGFFHLHRETSEEIKGHLTSEEQRVYWKGFTKEIRWVRKEGGGPNHLWDCCVYATAAAELAGVGLLRAPKPAPAPQPQRQPKRRGSGFLDDLPSVNR